MQREIVADLIIVTVIMNEENDLNFAQCESNKESVDQFSKENKENIVKQVTGSPPTSETVIFFHPW